MYLLKSEPFRIPFMDTKVSVILITRVKQQAKVVRGSKEDKYPPVDFSNDMQMVGEDLRCPLVKRDNSILVRDKKGIKMFKHAYSKLKENKKMYNDTLSVLLKQFDSKTPKWGSLIFNGVRV